MKKGRVPSKQLLALWADWRHANAMLMRAKGPIERGHWQEKQAEIGAKIAKLEGPIS